MTIISVPVRLLFGRTYFYVVILCVMIAQYLIVLCGLITTEAHIVGAVLHHPIGLVVGMWAIGRTLYSIENNAKNITIEITTPEVKK